MLNRLVRSAGAALLLAAIPAIIPGQSTRVAAAAGCGTDLKLLVVAADGTEPALGAIRHTLDYLGTPYDVFVAASQPTLKAEALSVGCHALYQGVILTSAELVYASPYGYLSAFEPGEQAVLDTFAAQTGARELIWYSGWTGPDWGVNWPSGAADTSTIPLVASFTAAGRTVFPHVNTAFPLQIRNAYTYLTTASDAASTPLMTDAAGHALAITRQFPDGRQALMLMFDSNQYLTHSLVLGYDLVSWVTKGLFLGERHAYLSPQIDDLFLDNDMWTPTTPCGTPVDLTTTQFRLKAKDYNAVVAWQQSLQRNPLAAGVRLTWAFNGWGAQKGSYAKDDLTNAVKKNSTPFWFVSHTWDHPTLDGISAGAMTTEVLYNDLAGLELRLGNDVRALVTPNVSGLTTPAAMRTAYNLGVRYIVTDTSIPGYMNPTPNTGLYNPLAPGLFMIPRYPTNLYFNVSTPDEWTAEYNCMYRSYWGRDFNYADVLNNISDSMVSYLLNGDLNPLMFHQPNTRAYDGVHSLLGDLIDLTVAKYGKLVTFPILTPAMTAVGDRMIARQKYNEAGVTASYVPGTGVVISARKPVTVPVTGLKIAGAEAYGGSSIAYVTLSAGQSKTIHIP